MPMGSRHDERGLLMTEGRWIVLARDDGGRWRLDGPRRMDRALGRRVRVVGVRAEFDLLDVERFELL